MQNMALISPYNFNAPTITIRPSLIATDMKLMESQTNILIDDIKFSINILRRRTPDPNEWTFGKKKFTVPEIKYGDSTIDLD